MTLEELNRTSPFHAKAVFSAPAWKGLVRLSSSSVMVQSPLRPGGYSTCGDRKSVCRERV